MYMPAIVHAWNVVGTCIGRASDIKGVVSVGSMYLEEYAAVEDIVEVILLRSG